MDQLNKYAVIVAGGQGTRMGSAVPKQFLELNGKPVLYHTINAFLSAVPDVEIILVLPAEQLSYANMVLQAFDEKPELIIVTGGATRFHSVYNGLKAINGEGIVFIHDGVRPLLSSDLIKRCLEQAVEKGSAVPAIALSDSMRIKTEDGHHQVIDREKLLAIQTPQTFKTEIILKAFEQEYSNVFTDEASVVESDGMKVYLIEGEKRNIKITLPEDLLFAEAVVRYVE